MAWKTLASVLFLWCGGVDFRIASLMSFVVNNSGDCLIAFEILLDLLPRQTEI